MKKRTTVAALPPRKEFCTRFLRKLQSFHTADPMIALILKDQNCKDQCANLIWNCYNDAPARLARIADHHRDFWASEFKAAIRGAEAIALIYRESDNPRTAEFAQRVRSDLLEKQRNMPRAFPPQQARGRAGRDWSAVLYAQRMLEYYLDGEQISDSTLAMLLDVGSEVAGRKETVTKDAVRLGLARLNERLPIVQNVLSKFYPRGEKFTPTQLARK